LDITTTQSNQVKGSNTNLIVIGIIAVIAVIGILLYFVHGGSHVNSILSPGTVVNYAQLSSIIRNGTNSTNQLQVNYTGQAEFIAAGQSSGSSSFTFTIPFSIGYMKYNKSTRIYASAIGIPVLGNMSIVSINVSKGASYSCIKSSLALMAGNTSTPKFACTKGSNANNPSQSLLNESSLGIGGKAGASVFNSILLTVIGPETYKGQQCILLAGKGNIKENTTSLNGTQISQNVGYNISTCISSSYYVPLNISIRTSNVNSTIGNYAFTIFLNEIELSPTVSQAAVTALPGPIENSTSSAGGSLTGNTCIATPGFSCSGANILNGNLSIILGQDTGSSMYNLEVACVASPEPSGFSNPQTSFMTLSQIGIPEPISALNLSSSANLSSGGETFVAGLPCYGTTGDKIGATANAFFGQLWLNYTMLPTNPNSITNPWYTVNVSALAIQQPQVFNLNITITTTVPYTTIPASSTSSMNGTSCGAFNLSTSSLGSYQYGSCAWPGGMLDIYANGGDSGYLAYTISGGPTNQIYVHNSTVNRCSGLVQSIYLPAQTYEIMIHTGEGGGYCGDAGIQMAG
jgi:hypothetical protein